jgi:hypothetical protein
MKNIVFGLALFALASTAFAVTGPFTKRIAFTSERDGNSEIYTITASGSVTSRLTNNTAIDAHATFSFDGTKIAFMSARDGNNEIYVMNANGTDQKRLTFNAASDAFPTWSPDGKKIAFLSNRNGGSDIFIMTVDGGEITQLTFDPAADTEPSFSPRGDKIVFVSNRDGNNEIYVMNADGSAQTRLTNNFVIDQRPKFSRIADKITFARDAAGSSGFSLQVVTMNANGTNATVLTSAGTNNNPEFDSDGTRIFFNSNRDGNIEIYTMASDGTNQVRLTNNPATDIAPATQAAFEREAPGVYRPTVGQWSLKNQISGGPTFTVSFGGQPGDLPLTGNWDGDARTDIGIFRDGTFLLALVKKNAAGGMSVEELPPITFGQAGDLPVSGDWNGDGKDDVGVFRPGTVGKFLMRQPIKLSPLIGSTIILTLTANLGTTGDLPVAGDWDGDGTETPGVFRPSDPGEFFLSNSTTSGTVDVNFIFGSTGNLPMAGDWLGLGRDGIGVFLPGNPLMLITSELASKGIIALTFGQSGDIPVSGSWPQ